MTRVYANVNMSGASCHVEHMDGLWAGADAIDPIVYFRTVIGEIASTLNNGLELHTCIRWILGATVIFERIIKGEEQETRFEFNSEQQILLRPDETEQQVEAAISRLLALILEMSERERERFCL